MTRVHGSRRALGIFRFIGEPARVIEEIFYLCGYAYPLRYAGTDDPAD
jgi:hypothetical protein